MQEFEGTEMITTDTAALVRQMRDALKRIDSAIDPDDWAGDDRMMDITGPAIAAADQWLEQQRDALNVPPKVADTKLPPF